MGFTRLQGAWNALAGGIDRVVRAPIAVVVCGGAAVARHWKDSIGADAEHARATRARPEAAIADVIHTAGHVFDALAADRRRVRNAVAVSVITGNASVGRSRLDAARSPLRVVPTRLLPKGAVAERADAWANIPRRTLTTGADGWDTSFGAAAGSSWNPGAARVVTCLRRPRSAASRLPREAHAAGGGRTHADGRVAAARLEGLPLPIARTGARRLPVATRGARQTLDATARETSTCRLA